jgi:PAS domain S-box-containing protein
LFRVATGWSHMAAVNLIGSYNYALVALSVLIAMLASYAALDLVGRVTAAGGWTRAVWLLGGAIAMGTGIWSMHYIGMLAFILPIPVAYHWPTVLLSLFAAIVASVVALGVVSRQKMGWFRALAGSVLMGAGIASMHYIGMAAMRLPAICQFNSFLVILSVVFAVLISLAALRITFRFRNEKTGIGWEKLTGAVVMGAAIPVMHYTGMAAASFTASDMPTDLSHAVSISILGTSGIAAVTFIVLGLALLTSWADRRFATQTLEVQEEKLQQSEAYLSEAQRLSHTGSFGWRVSTGEIIWSEETFRIFQYDRAVKPGVEQVLQRVHPEDAALVRQTIGRAAQDGKDFDFEHRLLMPDGSVKHVHVVAHAERDEAGEVEFVGAVMDTTESKRAEKKLRRSEESLLEAQKLSHTGSWRHDVASGEVTVSPEVYRIHDIKPDDDPSNTEFFFGRFLPEDRKRVVDLFERSEIEKTEFQVDYRIVLPDGTIKHLHTIGRPVLNESGDLVEFVGTAIDVTAAKHAEEALRRSESNLAEAQRLTHTGSWTWRVAGKDALYLSEEWYRIYGFDPEKGMPAWEERLKRVHPEDRAKWQGAIDRAIREKSDYEVEFRILLPNGTVKYIHTVGHPVLNASGDLTEFVGSATDVTERKQAEVLLAGENRLLEMIARGDSRALILDAICRLVEEQASGSLPSILLVDPSANRLRHGAAPSLPSPYNEAVDGVAIGPSAGSCGTAAYRAEPVIVSDINMDPLWADYRDVALAHGLRACWSTPILSSAGKVLGTFAIYYRDPRSPTALDHSFIRQIVHLASIAVERKQAEEALEALRQSQAELARVSRVTTMGELTASLAHEVNQPIAAAVTNANTCLRWLTRDHPDVEEARAAAMRIVKDGTRAAEIVSRIRHLFKKGASERELVDVNEIIREMIVLLLAETTRYDILVGTDLAEDLPQVMADRVQLQQVLMNLMINGIEAMKDVDGMRELMVKSQRAENDQILVSVSDTGVGLPDQQVEHIFEAFFTTKSQGTGMGLRISRSIIESHGGRLWAADNSGRGASFCFSLPTKAEAPE